MSPLLGNKEDVLSLYRLVAGFQRALIVVQLGASLLDIEVGQAPCGNKVFLEVGSTIKMRSMEV